MAHRVRELLVEGADQVCPRCGGRSWWVAVLASALESDGAGGAFVDLEPAPMARCASRACGLSAHLDADPLRWEP